MCAAVCGVAAASAVSVAVAGRAATSLPPPLLIDGHLMLPAPFLTERLGLRIEPTSDPAAWRISSYGRYLKVHKDSALCVVDTTAMKASHPARVVNGRLYVPAEMLARAFAILWGKSEGGTDFELRPPGAAVQDVREGRHDDRLRLVIDLTGPAPYWASASPGELLLDISPPDPRPSDWGCLRLFTFSDAMKPKVTAKASVADWMRLTISYESSKTPAIMTLGDPCRIVVEIPREPPARAPGPAAATEPEQAPSLPAPAATGWNVRHFSTERGLVRVFVLRATPTAIRPALAGKTIHQRASVSLIAARAGARAAVNGGYFDSSGPPLGMLVINGEWIKHPTRNRCVLGVTEAGKALMGRLRFEGAVRINGLGKLDLAGLNTGHWKLEYLILYTRRWGEKLNASPTKVRLVVNGQAKVARVETGLKAVAIPSDGYVLSAGGKVGQRLARARIGAPISVTLTSVPDWPELRHAIGAGPQLVKEGRREVSVEAELFRADVRRVCSRTAVGIAEDGNVILVGAEATIAGGLSLSELASVMWKLGCREAMALDGGGSTTVFGDGRVLNDPSDGWERAVSNALLVFPGPA